MKSLMVLAEIVEGTHLFSTLPFRKNGHVIRCTRKLAEECGYKILSDVR